MKDSGRQLPARPACRSPGAAPRSARSRARPRTSSPPTACRPRWPPRIRGCGARTRPPRRRSGSAGWTLPGSSRALLGPLAELASEVREAGLDHVVLCGMGGSSLAPEVISRTANVPLTVLDTTDPHAVRRALSDRLDGDAGGGLQQERLDDRDRQPPAGVRAGLRRPRPGRRRDRPQVRDGHRPRLAAGGHGPPGRVSRGARRSERGRPLQRADRVRPGAHRTRGRGCGTAAGRGRRGAARAGLPDGNPGLELGAALGGYALAGHDKVVLADCGSGLRRLRRLGGAAHRRVHRQARAGASCRWWWAARTPPASPPAPTCTWSAWARPLRPPTPR